MAVKRYRAQSDNTITNAFEENLTTRGTGSNMGASDILEVFSIYAQASSTSAEKSRVLIKFDATASTDSIKSDRTDGVLPASGSVSFYLRLFNAPHSQTLPKNFTMDVSAINGDWTEGTGLDMELYKDKGSSNWVNATSTSTAATATVTVLNEGFIENDDVIILLATNGSRVILALNDSDTPTSSTVTAVSTAGSTSANDAVLFAQHNGASTTAQATLIATAINHHALFTATAADAVVTITQATAGLGGNTTVTCVDGGGGTPWFSKTNFTGANGAWATTGGDYYTDTSSSFSASFDAGTEDIEVDITTLVEQWLNSAGNVLGSKDDNGVGVFNSNVYESAARSYYTKKFFGKDTEFFFKRPCIEARWDSATKDDRGTTFYSSSLATGAENLNTIYFYNYFRGQLRNIPGVGTAPIYVSLFSGSAADTAPTASALELVVDEAAVTHADRKTVVTGAYVSTGIYSASFCLTAASTPLETIYDVWFSGGAGSGAIATTSLAQYHTGTIKPETLYGSSAAPASEYVSSITNFKPVYRGDETARFRIYTRQKDWSPTIYTKATAQAEVTIVESGSYEIYRVVDDLKIIPYGTGSDLHTQMSFDTSGSYFDLDMQMLEAGYMYGIKFAYYNNSVGAYVEQPETFKFRVESRQS